MTSLDAMIRSLLILFVLTFVAASASADSLDGALTPVHLRCEYLVDPLGIDETEPRLTWRVQSDRRGQVQTAYQILVASDSEKLAMDQGDLWDTGKIASSETLHIPYAGEELKSRQVCFWKVKTWDAQGNPSNWSDTATWSMGLLNDNDWRANYISYDDDSAIHTDTSTLYLPAARQYRKKFDAGEKTIERATVYATALGIYELHLNGKRVGDAYFAPGWTDYLQRAYYNTYDVTDLVQNGDNALGAWVAEGWYSGYVAFGLLTGMGTEKNGRSNYGKIPAVMAQLEIHYSDGTTEIVTTDSTWKVTGAGPIQEADLLMGEAYDARREMTGWATAGFDDSAWDSAIPAEANGDTVAMFYEARNPDAAGRGPQITGEPRNLGFKRPKLEAFPGVPVRITEEIPSKSVTKRDEGVYTFDLGQNFAGVIRMKVKGPAGHKIQIRYGEMLHPDGRLMTENLRKARATDYYICKGDPDGEIYVPRFTFHGFQFVEVSNFPTDEGETPSTDAVTGLVMHSDTPMTSEFTCNDPMVNRLFQNVVWTQRSNFLDLPTDCPQRDERMGWTGDAQAYVGTAAYNADIGAFYTKWLRELMESQRPSGAFPGYAPFTFQHGWDFGTAWADAGVICPWTIWQAYGDQRVIRTCWEPMTRFMEWRTRTSQNDLGIAHGNAWGDWLAQGASTPLDFVDTIYLAISSKMMAEMAEAIGEDDQAKQYRNQFDRTKQAFNKKYVDSDGRVNVRTQSAQALALFADLIPADQREATGAYLAEMIAKNGNRMSTGFLGTRPLLPVLSESGQHDLATFLLQSRDFPSWGYEIANGATTIWERWDSYTKEDAFGRHNAAMNSFSHYAFGAVCEWMFGTLAGIRSDGPGYANVIIDPRPPRANSNAMRDPIDQVTASYDSIRGMILSDWKIEDGQFRLNVTVPANTTATVYLPTDDADSITEGGQPISANEYVQLLSAADGKAKLKVGSGSYSFVADNGIGRASKALETSEPQDTSINPDEIDMTRAKQLIAWDFSNPSSVERWKSRNHLDVQVIDDHAVLSPTGDDSQLAITMNQAVQGDLVLAIEAHPVTDETLQFFWASPQGGFNATQMDGRDIKASKTFSTYLFKLNEKAPVGQLRIDPFRSFDPYAKQPKMLIKSIAIYDLSGGKKKRMN
ncbi:Bacterial alpha-L-rhamnosidase [Neorhodopirellula pilleata]|uniref:alpha-L-rhamnosidase n=1 Tax=Neorhodopirellula pilleata TaxID=2714738 RepID=A0A5C6AVW8_9BACT|nr:Bacterial alpha-L-rhamnosidase [Neorhodopirellula pilleata]